MARKAIAAAVLLLALFPAARLAWMAREMPHFGHLHDDSIYFVAAKSIADGSGYRILSLPDEPFQTKYPPLGRLRWLPSGKSIHDFRKICAGGWRLPG